MEMKVFGPDDYAAALALWKRCPGVGLSSADEREALSDFLARNPGLPPSRDRVGTRRREPGGARRDGYPQVPPLRARRQRARRRLWRAAGWTPRGDIAVYSKDI